MDSGQQALVPGRTSTVHFSESFLVAVAPPGLGVAAAGASGLVAGVAFGEAAGDGEATGDGETTGDGEAAGDGEATGDGEAAGDAGAAGDAVLAGAGEATAAGAGVAAWAALRASFSRTPIRRSAPCLAVRMVNNRVTAKKAPPR